MSCVYVYTYAGTQRISYALENKGNGALGKQHVINSQRPLNLPQIKLFSQCGQAVFSLKINL